MARVDFYLLAASGEEARCLFACRLAEKAYRLQNSIRIQAGDLQQARQLDELLWTFRDGSFVPHALAAEAGSGESPVTIGVGAELPPGDLLINLADEMPAALGSFPRVAEIVTSDEDCRRRSRKRFAAYRSQGHDLQTHEV